MSYCRFSEADAYIYDDSYYGLLCAWCSMGIASENFVAGYNYDLMLDHIHRHREQGDYIPEHVDERLREERNENYQSNQ